MAMENSKRVLQILGLFNKPNHSYCRAKLQSLVIQGFWTFCLLWKLMAIISFAYEQHVNSGDISRVALVVIAGNVLIVSVYMDLVLKNSTLKSLLGHLDEIVKNSELMKL